MKIYCHGHTHRGCLADLRGAGLPLIFDSGSAVFGQQGRFHTMELEEELTTSVFEWKAGWGKQSQEQYGLV